jgi:hypothetical protein
MAALLVVDVTSHAFLLAPCPELPLLPKLGKYFRSVELAAEQRAYVGLDLVEDARGRGLS